MSRTYTTVWDGLKEFLIADPKPDGTMPLEGEMTAAAEVYGGGITFKGEKPSKKEHFVEGRATPKHVQLKAGAKEGTFQIWATDLDKLKDLMGGTVTTNDGKARFKSPANYTGVTKALRFKAASAEGEEPVCLDFPKATLFVAENFVMNDESVWIGDVTFNPLLPWEINGVPVEETP